MTEDTAREFINLVSQMRQFMRNFQNSYMQIPKSEYFFLHNVAECLEEKRRSGLSPKGVTVSELGRYQEITTPAISKMLRSVEGKGLIRRVPDEKDRRIVYLVLTSEGEIMIRKVEEEMLAHTMRIVDRMGDVEAKEFIRLFGKFIDSIREEQEEKK